MLLFLALISGTIAGILLRRHSGIVKAANHAMSLSVLALLFLLGLSVGMNEEITANFGRLGVEALLLSVAGTGGSIFLVYLLNRRYFR